MRITSDNFPIYLALGLVSVSLLAYVAVTLLRREEADSRLARLARKTYVGSVGFTVYAMVYLLQQILSCARYDIDYIYSYSGPNDLLLYRFSSLWAGHEGSLLFWAVIGGLIGCSLMGKRQGRSSAAMAFWTSIQLFFLLLLVITDPFAPLKDYQPGVLGSGLRLELQNPWMAIHPPIVFLGYAALAVPAALAIQALAAGDLRRWATRALPWALFGWVSLGAGLILGMVWSYEELGWGGYWAWDPVENSSLVPWVISTALVHGLILQRYKNRMTWPNVLLAMSAFLTVIAATFLTRSGVLSKVSRHSFADLGTSAYLLGFLAFYVLLCVGLALYRMWSVRRTPAPLSESSKDFTMVLGSILFALYGVAILAGTIYPLLSQSTLKPEFYTNFSKPVAAVTILLIILSSMLGWSGADGKAGRPRFDGRLWKTGAHFAHLGVILMVMGMVFSSFPKELTTSRTLALPEGETKSALGLDFEYTGRDIETDSETMHITATSGKKEVDIPLVVRYSQRGQHARPGIVSTLAGDLYVAPSGLERVTVTPTASLTEEGFMSLPVRVADTAVSLSITDVGVDEGTITLRYQDGDQAPQELTLAHNVPTEVDGYSLLFEGFVPTDGETMGQSVGAYVSVKGNGLGETAIVEVSRKPFMWLLWMGTALITLGGIMATWRRFREKRTDDGILPDSL